MQRVGRRPGVETLFLRTAASVVKRDDYVGKESWSSALREPKGNEWQAIKCNPLSERLDRRQADNVDSSLVARTSLARLHSVDMRASDGLSHTQAGMCKHTHA